MRISDWSSDVCSSDLQTCGDGRDYQGCDRGVRQDGERGAMRGHAALLLLTAGLGLALPATAQDKSAIETERPWARASIGTARPAAAYGTLVNTGSEAMRLVAVETPVAGRAETHRTVRDGDVMRMEPAEIVEVPAGGQGEFGSEAH